MKVLVTLPNGRTTYCVECYPKSIGGECLEKVIYYPFIVLCLLVRLPKKLSGLAFKKVCATIPVILLEG